MRTVTIIGLALLLAACNTQTGRQMTEVRDRAIARVTAAHAEMRERHQPANPYASTVDPGFRAQPAATRAVLVLAPTLDINRRYPAEVAMANAVRDAGFTAVNGLDVFPPSERPPTNDQIATAVRERRLDGAVVLSASNEKVAPVPVRMTIANMQVETIRPTGKAQTVEVFDRRNVPATADRATAAYSAMFLTPQGARAWTAEATLTGPTFETLAATAGSEAIAKLRDDGVLAQPKVRSWQSLFRQALNLPGLPDYER